MLISLLRWCLQVPLAGAGCALFQFHELCEMPLGAADFIGLFSECAPYLQIGSSSLEGVFLRFT